MNELVKGGELTPSCIKELLSTEKKLKELKEKQEQLRNELKTAMIENGIKSYKGNGVSVQIVDGGKKEHFNVKKFREEHSELYDEYIELIDYAESLRVKI